MKKIIMAVASAAVACCIGFAAVGCGGSQLITVFNRESGSGTRGAFTDILGIEEEELIPGAAQHSSTGAVVTAVADDPNAIGYISLGSLDDSVKALSVEGVVPSEATVQDGTYKIARPFELMYQEENVEKNDLLAEFLEYLESADVQPTVAEEGYVSLDKEFADYTAPEAQFETTTLDVGGSTSVQPFMAILAEQYEALIKETTGQEITISVQGGGSGAGKTGAANGSFDIGMASEEVSASDFENPTGTMVVDTLCMDGIAVVVNPANDLTNITLAQLKDIYTGVITDWSEIK